MRFDVIDKYGVLSDITNIMAKNKVSIKRLIQNPFRSKKYSSIIIISHKTKDLNIQNVIKKISLKNYLVRKPKLIRIESI